MSNINLEILERYVMNEDKNKALDLVTPFTEQYYFIQLMTDLNNCSDIQSLKTRVKEFHNNNAFSNNNRNTLMIKYLLLTLNSKISENERKDVIKELNDLYLHINFNHAKPQKVEMRNNLMTEEHKDLKSKIELIQEEQLTNQFYIDEFYKSLTTNNLHKIKNESLNTLDLNKVKAAPQILKELFDITGEWFKSSQIVSFLKELSISDPTMVRNHINTISYTMNAQQLDELMKEEFFLNLEDLFRFYFGVKFDDSKKTQIEQKENLIAILNFFEDKPIKYKQTSPIYRKRLLELNYNLNVIDEDLFIEYLENPHIQDLYLLKPEQQLKVTNYNSINKCVDLNFSYCSDSELVLNYLNRIFQTSDGYKKYLNYFDENLLQTIYYSNKLMQGNKISNINNILTDHQLKEINEKKILKLERNKESFKINEKVELNLTIKNIKTLKVRVLEVNTESYLLQNNFGDYKDIKVDSLIPFEEYSYSYSQASMVVHEEKLEFLSITDKERGVFIIDLIGDELNSKAIIFKGNLTLIYDKVSGRNCVLLDEKNEICKSERTGLYIGNKFFKANDITGIISIPQDVDSINSNVIVVHDNFANLCYLELKDLVFTLDSAVIYNSESFMPGLETLLILKNSLWCNEKKSDLSLLKNSEVTLLSVNMAGVEQKQVLKDLLLCNDKDLEINFRVPSKMKSLDITLKAELQVNGKTVNVSKNISLVFQRKKMNQKLDLALKKNQEKEYLLELFGINGEAIPNEKLDVIFNNSKISKQFSFLSDSEGKVNLGKLNEIMNFSVTVRTNNFNFSLTEPNDRSYPNSFNIIENENITLPLLKEDEKDLLLYKFERGVYSLNLHNHLKTDNNLLNIENLQEGEYKLHLNSKLINITVHKGLKKNINGVNIINDDFILALKDKRNGIVTQVEENDENYVLNLQGDLKDVRVHLLSSNYKEDFVNGDLAATESENNLLFSKRVNNNHYLSEARLSDELIYVYNRKTKNTYLGNTLDKPGMLLKRNKVNETKEQKELLNPGHAFDRFGSVNNCAISRCPNLKRLYDGKHSYVSVTYLREFFKNPGQLISNLIPEENKLVIKKSAFANHSLIYAIINTNDSSLLVEIGSKNVEVEKIDLRLEESRKKGFVYRYDRSMDYLEAEGSFNIPHVDKQEYCFIEDLKSLFDAISVVSNNSEALEAWKFLPNWSNLTPQDKLKNYDKFCSHEMNLFLKLKDRVFFDEVVKAFIDNKKEKTLVDFYLLENAERLVTYAGLSNLHDLSPLESVLLIDGLKDKHRELAESILQNLTMKSKLNPRNEDQTKKKFDSLLSSQKQDEKDDDNGKGHLSFANSISQQVPMSNYAHTTRFVGGRNFAKAEQSTRMLKMSRSPQMEMEIENEEALNNCYNQMDYMNYEQNLNYSPEVFTPLQGTVEYNEKKYYHEYSRNLSVVENFWSDLGTFAINHKTFKNFFSENFIHCCNFPTEAIAILGFIDLEFVKLALQSDLKNNDLLLHPKTQLICLTKEIIQNKGEKGELEIMIGQRFFDPEDKFKLNEIENIQYEKPVKEFIQGVIYESNIVVTNSTSTPLTVDLISEIPKGSIAFYSLDTMNVQRLVLEPLKSNSYSFHFYFPAAGIYTVYPASVVKDDQLLGCAQIEETIEVKENRTIRDMDTISDILSTGDIGNILNFIESKNILNPQLFNFNDIYWLLKMKSFYEQLIPILKKKGVFNEIVWSYSIYHNDLETLREYVDKKSVKNNFGLIKYLNNDFINIDDFEIKEYYPLVNPRVHSLKQDNNILNVSFKDTYTKLLDYLFQKGKTDTADKLVLINYLICQDRMQEAIEYYSTIQESEIQSGDSKIQYDYLTAYLDFISGYPDFVKAKKICEDYLSYPVLTWRNLFVEIANQLAEFEETKLIDDILQQEQDKKKNIDKAKTQSSFNCELNKNQIKIVYENISSVVIKCYKIDLEVYFSMNAFNTSSIKEYTLVKPFAEEIVKLSIDDHLPYVMYDIPENIAKENLFIEISSVNEGLNKSQYLEYLPFSLNYHINKEFGIIKLFDENTKKPVPKVYMKCFAKYKNNDVKFYKDGYSDLRGSFDYVSLNKDNLDDISLFRVLIVSEYGCKIVETEPPVKIGRVEGEAKKLISNNWMNIQKSKGMERKNEAYQQVYF